MPPTVARKSSRSRSGPHSTSRPSAVRRVMRSTKLANEPSRWWFLPWTSQATHAPTVTNLVPGVTGGNQPAGHEEAQDLGEAQPRLAVEPPGRGLERADAVGARALEHEAARGGRQRRVAVGAPEPARHQGLAVLGQGQVLRPLAPARGITGWRPQPATSSTAGPPWTAGVTLSRSTGRATRAPTGARR